MFISLRKCICALFIFIFWMIRIQQHTEAITTNEDEEEKKKKAQISEEKQHDIQEKMHFHIPETK